MSTEKGSGGRSSGTCDIATVSPLESYTSTSIGVPEDTDSSMQFITVEPVDTVNQLLVSPSPASGGGFTALVLWSSTVSFFLCRVDFTEILATHWL